MISGPAGQQRCRLARWRRPDSLTAWSRSRAGRPGWSSSSCRSWQSCDRPRESRTPSGSRLPPAADDAAVHQRIRIRHRRAVRQRIAQALIVDQPVLSAEAAWCGAPCVQVRSSTRFCTGKSTMVVRVCGVEGAHAVEIRVRALPDAVAGIALANVAVAQAVHQVRRERGVESRSQSLAVAAIGGAGRIAGKLRHAQRAVVLQIAANEQPVAVGSDVVELGDGRCSASPGRAPTRCRKRYSGRRRPT